MSKLLVISPSKLERFRQYLDGEFYESVTAEKVIESIKGLQPWTPKMTFGTAFHAILEEGISSFPTEENHVIVRTKDLPDVLHIPIQVAKVAEKYRTQHPSMVYEVKLKGYVDTGSHKVLLNGRMDGVEGLHLHEQKTSSRKPDLSFYERSAQWKCYLMMAQDAKLVQYNLFCYQLKEGESIPNEIEPFSFQLLPYPELERDVIHILNEFIRFCKHHGLLSHIESKY